MQKIVPMKLFYSLYDNAHGYTRAAITLLAGLVFVIWPQAVQNTIIYILGALILISGIISLVTSLKNSENADWTTRLMSANGWFSIAFGAILMIFPSFFMNILVFLFGIILLLVGIGSIAAFLNTRKLVKTSWTSAIIPILITLCGFSMFFFPNDSSNRIFWIFGIALLIYGVSQLIETYNFNRRIKENGANGFTSQIEDTTYEEL